MDRTLKILVCGMPRSMTTWAFNVLRELLDGNNPTTLWIEPDSAEQNRFIECDGVVLGKCHHHDDRLAAAADLIVYSYRDLRTAAVSYRRKFGSIAVVGQVNAWIHTMQKWLPLSDIVLRYEEASASPLDGVAGLRAILLKKHVVLSNALTDHEILRRVDARFHARQGRETRGYDVETMILPEHRTFQPSPEELESPDRAVFDEVGVAFSSWLAAYGYIRRDASTLEDHGQETEYRIASRILRNLGDNLHVVDVGAEKGSFIKLALDSNAAHVVAVEALPRHQSHLAERFAQDQRVSILPFAASDRSGVSEFHVATDVNGNELDFHHTLADIGDSLTVIRTKKSIQVETATIERLVQRRAIGENIDFLKIDTDGHDLAVLKGLGNIRPRIIMAEFWEDLPETSGVSSYCLNDVIDWGRKSGYQEVVVVRRNGSIESIEFGSPWVAAGDWGNVFLIRNDVGMEYCWPEIEALALECYRKTLSHIKILVEECERKEIEIRRLDAALSCRNMDGADVVAGAVDSMSNSGGAISNITSIGDQLVAKEMVIRRQEAALRAYRTAFAVLRPFMPILRGTAGVARLFMPKLGRLYHHPPIEIELPPHRRQSSVGALPAIAMVTPSFRQARFIEATICSVLDQHYPNLEYYVQDGGSEDGTVDILKRYRDRLSGWISEPDRGQSDAINRGFRRASGEIMGWLNSDDLLLPGALLTVGEYFATHPEVDVVYGHRILIDDQDREIGRWVLPPHDDEVLSWADFIPQETMFWRRALWEKVGGIDESFRFAMDWDLLLRFRDAGARMVRLPHFLGAFRIHEAQKTSAQINEVGMSEMKRLRERSLGRECTTRQIRRALVPYLVRHLGNDLAFRVRRRLGRIQ